MLLTLTNTRAPATDLGWLLHKHPARVQAFDLAFGQAHVFYPDAGEQRCTAALLLDVDPVGLVRRRGGPAGEGFSLQQYVNDRPYVASSFMSVAIAQVFGTALGGRCSPRPELVDTVLPLEARLAVLPCREGEGLLKRLFSPLGYTVGAERHGLDATFPAWGESHYYTVTLSASVRLCDLLTHLYVLIPVLDNDKHYWVGDDEVDKLLRRGEGWLATHPERELIARRYLKQQRSLAREALIRLAEEDHPDPDAEQEVQAREEAALEAGVRMNAVVANCAPLCGKEVATVPPVEAEGVGLAGECGAASDAEHGPTLHKHRLETVLSMLRRSGARSVIDVGCGEGRLLAMLLDDAQFERIVGMDVSMSSLRRASDFLRLDRLPPMKRRRIELMHGSLTYRDARFSDFDAMACVEVIEHLDPPRLAAFERVVFEFARPHVVILTTPNREYNVTWERVPAGALRHRDHRFEWTRRDFEQWAGRVAARFGYVVRCLPVGPEDERVGAPTQMGVFELEGKAG